MKKDMKRFSLNLLERLNTVSLMIIVLHTLQTYSKTRKDLEHFLNLCTI